MTASNSTYKYQEKPDEISIKKFLLIVGTYCKLIVKFWYWIVMAAAIFGGYTYYKAQKILVTYPASIKLLATPQKLAKENKQLVKVFANIINSKNLLLDVLLNRIVVAGKDQLLINLYLETYFDYKPMDLDPDIPAFFQFKNSQLAEMTTEERKILNLVLKKVTTPKADFSDGFISTSSEVDLGFITINTSTPTEVLTLLLLEELYNTAKVLITENAVFADKRAYNHLSFETDSLAAAYKGTYFRLNNYIDQRERLLNQEEPDVKGIKWLEKEIYRLSVDAEISKAAYLAALEQLKTAQVKMDQNALLVHVLDRSLMPLEPYQPDAKVAAVKGGIMGIVLAVFLILVVRIFKDVVVEIGEEK